MKNDIFHIITNNIIVLLLIILIFTKDILSNENILSKFHQHSYKLKDVRIELIRFNNSYYNFFEIKAFKYNRTTTAHNGTFNFKVDTGDKIEVVVQAYKFLSNEYRSVASRFQVNLQKSFQSNAMGLHNINKCGNITPFYFHKDITYHGCNFVLDETKFPPLIPNGRYKIELTELLLNIEIGLMNVYLEVYTPIAYFKK